ncbi:hypothetical protein ACFX1Q_028784 [Malus domestica]
MANLLIRLSAHNIGRFSTDMPILAVTSIDSGVASTVSCSYPPRLGPRKSKHCDALVMASQKKMGLDVSEQNLGIGCRLSFLVPLNTKQKLGIR